MKWNISTVQCCIRWNETADRKQLEHDTHNKHHMQQDYCTLANKAELVQQPSSRSTASKRQSGWLKQRILLIVIIIFTSHQVIIYHDIIKPVL